MTMTTFYQSNSHVLGQTSIIYNIILSYNPKK
jgi:hypothetical protein